HPDGKKTAVASANPAAAGDGTVTFANMLTDSTYELSAQPANALRVVLMDTLISVTGMDGSVQADSVSPLEGGAGFSTFAFKGDQNKINGTLKAIDGSADVTKRLVKIMPDPGNIQPRVFADGSSDTTVVSDATGGFRTYANLREGKWIVTPLDSVTAAGDSIWAFYGTTADLTLKGTGNTESSGILRAYRMDTKIQGVVVNDHDMDLNVVDNGEALAVDVNLYRTKVDADSLVGTATSDGTTGAYSFTKLRQGTYVVQRVEPASGDVIVLRKTSKGDTAIVTTDAGANKTVGSLAPNPLPRWDYLTGSVANAAGLPYFTFLWENGTVSGRVIETGDVSTPVENITVSLYQCKTAVGVAAIDFAPTPEGAVAAGPPLDPSCTSYTQAAPLSSVATDADGNYSFSGLTEGIYEIRVSPATAGYSNDDTGPVIFKLLGSGDHEAFYNATVAASNHEVS
ncbi:MAG: hypothetical protein LJF04_12145, partial [Gemmatimonadetes bacterium]|nr:hypothetical protein [Gemmatimonadota bacterium]